MSLAGTTPSLSLVNQALLEELWQVTTKLTPATSQFLQRQRFRHTNSLLELPVVVNTSPVTT